jgi:hypothetical protein
MHATAMAVIFIGLGIGMLGRMFFRRPGVAFWTSRAPVWRALKPPGAILSIAGSVAGLVGLVLLVVSWRI